MLSQRLLAPVLAAAAVAGAVSGCGHSVARRGEQAEAFLPGAIAFWDDRRGLALFGPTNVTGKDRRRDRVARTSDGGRTWQLLGSAPNSSELVVAGARDAWLLEERGLLHSADGGRDWTLVSRYPLFAVSFAGPLLGSGLAGAGNRETFVQTRDGGRSWRRGHLPCTSAAFVDGNDLVSRPTSADVWVLCAGEPGAGSQLKELYASDDRGRTWRRGRVPGVGYLQGFEFANGERGWLWERRGSFLRSEDRGSHWRALAIGRPEEVEAASASFYSRTGGFALLHDSPRSGDLRLRLVRTRDGGRSWHDVRIWSVKFWPVT